MSISSHQSGHADAIQHPSSPPTPPPIGMSLEEPPRVRSPTLVGSRPHSPSSFASEIETPGSPVPVKTEDSIPKRNPKRKGEGSKILRVWSRNRRPEKPVGEAPGILQGLKAIFFNSWLNIFLVFMPLSWAFHWAKPDSQIIIFVFSFLSIIPLAKLLAFATDELAIRVGQTLAGLLNVTLGNAVEFIIAITAIVKCELQVVQSSLAGSILCDLLLVLGMCFFAGGLRYQEQGLGASAMQINSSLLTISVIAVLLPGAFHFAVHWDTSAGESDSLTSGQESSDIKKLSHGVSIILLFIYISYLIFQLWSHAALYDDEGNFSSTKYDAALRNQVRDMAPKLLRHRQPVKEGDVEKDGIRNEQVIVHEDVEEELEVPSMSFPLCIGLLIVVTVLIGVTANWLVDSIDGVIDASILSKEWVGLILVPSVSKAAVHVTHAVASVKDKLTLSIDIAVGASIQMALFVIPLLVIIAWIMSKPLLMLFDPFESVILFLAVIAVNYVVQDGKSNWLEGMVLMCLYVIIAVCFFFYPGSDIAEVLATCI